MWPGLRVGKQSFSYFISIIALRDREGTHYPCHAEEALDQLGLILIRGVELGGQFVYYRGLLISSSLEFPLSPGTSLPCLELHIQKPEIRVASGKPGGCLGQT